MKSIFEYSDHFSFLNDRLSTKNSKYGSKAKLADYLRIKASHLSQVLSKKFPLSLEQADLANVYFEHIQDECEFFLILVSRDRAGTESLKKHFAFQINAILKKRQLVVERLGRKSEVSDEAKGVYYSSWIYPAVHLTSTLPNVDSHSQIAQKLNMPVEIISQTIEFLLSNNLIKKNNQNYEISDSWIRIDRTSPHIIKHHANWRLKAVQNIETQRNEDLHYSGLFTMNSITANKIKNDFLDLIKSTVKEIEISPEENLFQLNTDFFKVTK